jgi:hypothetical protein
MQKLFSIISFLVVLFFSGTKIFAQDSLHINKDSTKKVAIKKDSSFKNAFASDTVTKKFNPTTATIRSAIIPGWGQAYNKHYWKIPIVWGALGTTAGIFFYNLKTYRVLRLDYLYKSDTILANDALIDPQYKNFSAEDLRADRDIFRQNIDYSVLFFLIFWGLNVVDATVDAHLKEFDVSSDLSLQIKPGYSQFANTNGISLVLNLDKKHMANYKSRPTSQDRYLQNSLK